MKNYFYLLAMVIILFTACQNENRNISNIDQVSIDTNMVKISDNQCYVYIKDRDTAILSFTTTNGIIVGDLSYKLYEKDSNKGLIEGEMKGDTLNIDYTI